MEEINAWGAYEAGTTQNARSLGTSTTRHRRATDAPAPPVTIDGGRRQSTDIISLRSSQYSSFFFIDDVASLKKQNEDTKDIEAVPEEKNEDGSQSKEWKDLRNLARDTFHVYFNMADYETQTSTVSTFEKKTKTKIYSKINGTMPYLTAYLKNLQLPAPFVNIILFTEASFRGMAQVYFQNNPLSGLFILTGMFVQSSRVAVHGIIAIIAGNLAGVLMGFDKSFLSCGLFGYNSFLVGLAMATFYSPEKHEGYSLAIAIGAVIFAYFSSVLFVMLGKLLSPYKTPPFTLPFNISTLLFLLAAGGMNNVDMAPVRTPELPSFKTEAVSSLTAEAFFAGSVRGVGQVFLANNIISGGLVLVGIMVCSRISAFAAFLGSAVGASVATLVGCSRDAIENGMYGFNPSLTMTAMLMFYVPSIGSISIGVIASIVTVFIQLALDTMIEPCGLPSMTLPFCFAALAFVVIQGTTSAIISVPLSSMTTPEDHLNRVSRLSHGFELLFGAIRSSAYVGSHHQRRLCCWMNRNGPGTKKMTSALSEYNQTLHGGESQRSLFQWILQCCKLNDNSSDQRTMPKLSFRIKSARFDGEKEKDAYFKMFDHIDVGTNYQISSAQFEHFLRSVDLTDEVGLDFACKAFQLMDLDGSGDIDCDEFFAFVQISKQMPKIQKSILKFFDFVDTNNNGSMTVSEFDSARSYLGLPPLPEEDHDRLVAICNKDKDIDFETLLNLVTIFKLKSMVKVYQSKHTAGYSRHISIESSIRSLKV